MVAYAFTAYAFFITWISTVTINFVFFFIAFYQILFLLLF